MNVHVQLKAVEIEAAGPLIRLGKISPIISQGIGPNPIEKLTTYTISAMSGIHPGTSILFKSYEYRRKIALKAIQFQNRHEILKSMYFLPKFEFLNSFFSSFLPSKCF